MSHELFEQLGAKIVNMMVQILVRPLDLSCVGRIPDTRLPHSDVMRFTLDSPGIR